eukprot:TRINITY_DN6199_c0_g3_i1.p1 TRINITY_DN6199_c0_g3~~TRINITY_DN6199_c0_g3_i1.p1  ORF type:complete len:152 (+),score=30.67 TRINITY_DN6199_c0_g3_i1:2-457(+)
MVEQAWVTLKSHLEKGATLDDMISAHSTFTHSITDRAFLDNNSMELQDSLDEILKIVRMFQQSFDKVHGLVRQLHQRCESRPLEMESEEEAHGEEMQRRTFEGFHTNTVDELSNTENVFRSFQQLKQKFLRLLEKFQASHVDGNQYPLFTT